MLRKGGLLLACTLFVFVGLFSMDKDTKEESASLKKWGRIRNKVDDLHEYLRSNALPDEVKDFWKEFRSEFKKDLKELVCSEFYKKEVREKYYSFGEDVIYPSCLPEADCKMVNEIATEKKKAFNQDIWKGLKKISCKKFPKCEEPNKNFKELSVGPGSFSIMSKLVCSGGVLDSLHGHYVTSMLGGFEDEFSTTRIFQYTPSDTFVYLGDVGEYFMIPRNTNPYVKNDHHCLVREGTLLSSMLCAKNLFLNEKFLKAHVIYGYHYTLDKTRLSKGKAVPVSAIIFPSESHSMHQMEQEEFALKAFKIVNLFKEQCLNVDLEIGKEY